MRVHFTGACGRAIGGLAAALKARGWEISASDARQHEPMKSLLRDAGLEIAPRFEAAHVRADLDMLVTGSAIDADHVEVRAARELGVPVMSMAQFLGERVLGGSRRIVVAGTNGKTTTTAMLACILDRAGLTPDYLIGGSSSQLGSTARFNGAPWAVLEGDEYFSGLEDKRPKFLHYRPEVLVLTNLEFDHAEMYADLEEVVARFEELVQSVPAGGRIIVSAGCQRACVVAGRGRAKVVQVEVDHLQFKGHGTSFESAGVKYSLPLLGEMNARDAALAAAAAAQAGVDADTASAALAEFKGVEGRMQIIVDAPGGTLISDEGYHPQALRENIAALRRHFPGRRLVVVLLPRLTGGYDGFQMQQLPTVLGSADRVVLAGLFDPVEYSSGAFSSRRLAGRIKRLGTPTQCIALVGHLPKYAMAHWRAGDVMLFAVPAGHDFLYAPFAERMQAGD